MMNDGELGKRKEKRHSPGNPGMMLRETILCYPHGPVTVAISCQRLGQENNFLEVMNTYLGIN